MKKAEPFIFIEATKKLGLEPNACFMADDNVHALFSAKRAGLKTIAVYDSYYKEYENELRSFADKADALKIRLMNEMDAQDRQIAYAKQLAAQKAAEEAARKAKEEGKEVTPVVPDPEPVKIKKTKNVTIKNMTNTSSWRLESEQDVDKYLAALKKSLLEELEGTDIVNVEF
jgi:hypothetical protein